MIVVGDRLGLYAALAERGPSRSDERAAAAEVADDLVGNLANPQAALSCAASTFQCTPASLAQQGAAAWGAQAGERPVRAVLEEAGFTGFRRVADTTANAVYAADRH